MESPENLHGPAVGVGQDATPITVDVDTAVFLLGAGVTTLTHPLLYVKLLIQHIVKVDGKRGLLRGLSPRIVSSAISTVVRSKVKQISTWTSWNIVLMLGVTNYLKSERKRTKTELHMLQRLIQKQRDSQ